MSFIAKSYIIELIQNNKIWGDITDIIVLSLVGLSFFFILLYNIVRIAVEDGTLNALIKYEKLKNQRAKSEDNKS